MFSHYIKFNETIQVIPTLYCLSASLLLDHAVECGMTQTDIHTAQRWCERDLAPVVSNLSHYSTTPEDLHLVYQNYSGQWCDGNYSDSVIFTINWSITRHHIMCHKLSQKDSFSMQKKWFLNPKAVIDIFNLHAPSYIQYNELWDGGEQRSDSYGEPRDELY